MNTSPLSLSQFAQGLSTETAFDVLAVARRLKAQGKDVIELQIGDSPFSSTKSALKAGIEAINANQTHYCASLGLPSFRDAVAANYHKEYGIDITAENVVVGPGAKVFEQFFCEAFIDPGDAVLVFSPHFPTYGPNIERRGGTMVFSSLKQSNHFRPDLNDVEAFVNKNNPKCASGALSQQSAQSDRRRGHCRRSQRNRRFDPRSQYRRLQRRALQPHGLDRQAPSIPSTAGHDRTKRRLLHLQQIVQHERLAPGLRDQQQTHRGCHRQDDQHRAVLRSPHRSTRG